MSQLAEGGGAAARGYFQECDTIRGADGREVSLGQHSRVETCGPSAEKITFKFPSTLVIEILKHKGATHRQ